LAQAFIIGESFVGDDPVALILGDNLFYGEGLPTQLRRCTARTEGATVFGYRVHDPQRYGVLAFDGSGRVSDIVEKPEVPPSSIAVTGLYFYDHHVVRHARSLRPSARGELEITDLNRIYLERGELEVERLGRGTAWLDTGTYGSLLQASLFVQAVEQRQGLMVGCIEEAAYRMGHIGADDLVHLADDLGKNAYAAYLRQVAQEDPSGVR
jgi:glucose-1-phosphate thymidylyltransferase